VDELFGVELVDGVVNDVPVGEVDISLGESAGDLFRWTPSGFVVEGSSKTSRYVSTTSTGGPIHSGLKSHRVTAKHSITSPGL
jgi:hypothetical protein